MARDQERDLDGGLDPRGRRLQPWPIRVSHWLNVPLLVIMAGSGLQILVAFPSLGPRGEPYWWYPFHGDAPPSWLRLGHWLAGARHWHFAFAWLFVANGLFYLTYWFASGEWRRRLFRPRRDARHAVQTAAWYLRVRKSPPEQGLYNGLQRLAYSTAIVLAALAVLSGVAIYKPVQLSWLARALGGYDSARALHLIALGLLALFTVGHVVMVSLHPRSLLAQITGGKRGE
jgi:Ni/Fe-hydrogenase b-type cytochrome subunit